MRTNSDRPNTASSQKNYRRHRVQRPRFPIRGRYISDIASDWKTFGHICTVHAQKRLFRSFRSKILPCRSLHRPPFPKWRAYYHYRMSFAAHILSFCDLDLWPIYLDDAWWIIQSYLNHTASYIQHIPIFTILRLSDPQLLVTQCDRMERSLVRMRCVTWPITGSKLIHIFEIHDPNLPIRFVTFRALRRKLRHVIGEK